MDVRLFVSLGLLVIVTYTEAKTDERDCEVCISVLDRFAKKLDEDFNGHRPKHDKIEAEFKDFCKNMHGQDERFCYFIGGKKESATGVLNHITKPLNWHMPVEKICKDKVKDVDQQICDLKYPKQIDLSSVDFKKLKVKDLKKILSDWGEEKECKGCTEKSEFIKAVERLLPKHAPEAVKKRTAHGEL